MHSGKDLRKLSSFAFAILMAAATLVIACPAFAQPRTATIKQLKSINLSKITTRELQREYSVEGYFVCERIPMLVKDLKTYRANTPMPESEYIVLRGKGIARLRQQEKACGSLVKVTGRLIPDRELVKDKITHVLESPNLPQITKVIGLYKPGVIDICKRYPVICRRPPIVGRHYALLYSGGFDPVHAYFRYWNDLKFMYLTLRSKYGFTDDQIVVVYKDGNGEDNDITVDYAASSAGLSSAINYLKSKMTARDDFFVFVTNHGGGYHDTSCGEVAKSHGGRADSSPGDEVDTYKWDEETYYYNQTSNDVWDDDFAQSINSLSFNRMTGVFEQCFSGGFLRDLKGSNRVLISAATEFQFSSGDSNYDTFSYHFTCALDNADDSGAALSSNPDTDGDGKISILEAFQYAKSRDKECESPQLEDSGDGVGTNTPSATGTDGKLAAGAYL
ncbi:MAG: hypothetical protein ABSA70_17255 [Terriglobia bacterium]